MNKHLIIPIAYMAMAMVSCGQTPKKAEKRSEILAEKVFGGQVQPDDIREICIMESNQRSVFPLPDPKLELGAICFVERDHIEGFLALLRNRGAKDAPLVNGYFNSFHILVKFESGEKTYLHGRKGANGFILQPFFTEDSIAGQANELYNFIAGKSIR